MSKEAMKLALEALERMKRYGNTFGYRSHEQNPYEQVCEAITALREALASEALDRMAENARELGLHYDPAQQEPVAFFVDGDLYYPEEIDWESLQEQGHTVASLYTSPQAQRTWVGLTDKEAMQICVDCGCLSEDWLTLLDAIESKLRSKNT